MAGGKTTPIYGIIQGVTPPVYLVLSGGHHGGGNKSHGFTIWQNQATVLEAGAWGDSEQHLSDDVTEWAVQQTIVPMDVPA